MAWWTPKKNHNLHSAEVKYGPEAFALTCLALELANSDDNFDTLEQERLSLDLTYHFDLTISEVEELVEAAREHQARSVETYGYTKKLRDSLDHEELVVVVETLWRLAFADGNLDSEEFAFMRKIPAALGVENYISEAAKRRAIEALS